MIIDWDGAMLAVFKGRILPTRSGLGSLRCSPHIMMLGLAPTARLRMFKAPFTSLSTYSPARLNSHDGASALQISPAGQGEGNLCMPDRTFPRTAA